MGEMGYGYGSECHLLRWMGRHRHEFDRAVLKEMGRTGASIDWLDFQFRSGRLWADAELKGLEFLDGKEWNHLQGEWAKFWPVGSGIHNWDAVGWIHPGKGEAQTPRELILVEAKANTGELKSDCKAKDESLKKIRNSLEAVRDDLSPARVNDWTQCYYQFANRLATLHFLKGQGVPANLLCIYFVGDLNGAGRKSPQTVREWDAAIQDQSQWIGLHKDHPLSNRIIKVFLKVDGGSVEG